MCANAPRDYTRAETKRLPAELHDIQKTAAKRTIDFPNQLTVAFLSVIIFAQLVCRKEHVKPIKQYFDIICC